MSGHWRPVCRFADLTPERAVAALLDGVQVALVRTEAGTVHALSNIDPFSRAAVLARGIVGDRGGEPVLISPMYKQAFALRTGACLDAPGTALPVFGARVRAGTVEVSTAPERP